MIDELYNKDNVKAYKCLLDLELISSDSNSLYIYFNDFFKMLDSDKSLVRIRGFRMISSLAKWDKDNLIDKNIEKILNCFNDSVGVNIRQYLSVVNNILLYKDNLNDVIEESIRKIDINKYKESMQFLIKKDINKLFN